MSIWAELLFLHGHFTRVPANDDAETRPVAPRRAADPERLRELIGCPSAGRRASPDRPLLGVRGLA